MDIKLIHEDERGKIFSMTMEELLYDEVTIFYTNAGYARGGCIHKFNNEYYCVIQGKVEYVTKKGNLSHHSFLLTGDSGIVPKGTPHYFMAVEDSVIMEWGATIEEKQEKHKEFRKIVDNINKRQSQ